MAKLTVEQIVEAIESLSVIELAELVKALEQKFGVSAAVPVATAVVQGASATTSAPVEEKTTFDVILADAGDKKKFKF